MRAKNGFVQSLVTGIAVFLCIMAGVLGIPSTSRAQFSTLHVFNTGGSDGTFPHGALTLSGSTLYGLTSEGGAASPSAGTVFRINTDGSGYQVLHNFSVSDGGTPLGSLTLYGSTLFGTTSEGGDSGNGTIFKINTDSSGFQVLHSFSGGSDGADPHGSLTLSGSTLYGMTSAQGGAGGLGTIFKMNTDGSGYQVLHNFGVNGGGGPDGSMVIVGSTLFGMTSVEGSDYNGTVFKMNTDGTGYQVLHAFSGGSDGANPYGDLAISGSTLYGMTSLGGSNGGDGTIFQINTDGTGYAVLHGFGYSDNGGVTPEGSLTISGTTLYGMASGGGAGSYGAIFQINADGTGYQVLHDFSGNDGGAPQGSLTLSGSVLYGMTMQYGGSFTAAGTIFSMVSRTVPGPPENVTATAGNAQATVSFTAPTSNGGSAITGYTVISNPPGGTDANAGSLLTTHTVKGLTNGTSYTFTVTATNAIGTGPASGPSNPVTPGILPGAPKNVTATAGNGTAKVSFKLPTNATGPITGCTVTSNPGGIIATGVGSPINVTGLTDGTAYTFTVTATNAIGTGPASSPSKAVTPVGPPGAPTILNVTGGNEEATVSFAAPSLTGGTPITSFTVTSNPGEKKASGKGSSVTVKGLTNGTSYTFTITATNKAGSGPASSPSNSVTPATKPGTPTGVEATAGDAEATVSFNPPSSDGGSPITGYTVVSNPKGGVDADAGTTSTTHNITGLKNGASYSFTVTATNAMGTSPASKASNKVNPAQ
jgi:uncharacterized repeat protein (TIGR03803 family)